MFDYRTEMLVDENSLMRLHTNYSFHFPTECDAFGSYTTRRQSEKQTNSSGTEIRDHDNDSTRRPSVLGDNETRETVHTPTIEPR